MTEGRDVSIARLPSATLAGKSGLGPLPPFTLRTDPPEGVPHREGIVWDQQVVVFVYASDGDLTLYIDDPYPFDQFIQVLNGRTILTDQQGKVESFVVGESFVLPKNFVGEWQLLDNYRELCVVEAMAFKSSEELGMPDSH